MHDKVINNVNGDYHTVARDAGQILRRGGTAQLAVAMDAQHLETIVAELVAHQAESIVETISARIVQRVFAEIKARERLAPPAAVGDADVIERLPMPTRVVTALHRLGIATIKQLTEMREEDLLGIPSLGEGSVRQVIRILALYGRKLAA